MQTITAYQLRTTIDSHLGQRATFTILNRKAGPLQGRTFDGAVLRAEVVMTSGPGVQTAVWIEGTNGPIWLDDNTPIHLLAA